MSGELTPELSRRHARTLTRSRHEQAFPHFQRAAHNKILWLRITLSDKLDAQGVDDWRQRFQTWLRQHELFAAIAPERVAILASGRLISAEDRGAVIGWLVAQPEVLVIRVERTPTRCAVTVQARPRPSPRT